MLLDELICEAKLADLERAIEAERAWRQFERSTRVPRGPRRPAVRRWRLPRRQPTPPALGGESTN